MRRLGLFAVRLGLDPILHVFASVYAVRLIAIVLGDLADMTLWDEWGLE